MQLTFDLGAHLYYSNSHCFWSRHCVHRNCFHLEFRKAACLHHFFKSCVSLQLTLWLAFSFRVYNIATITDYYYINMFCQSNLVCLDEFEFLFFPQKSRKDDTGVMRESKMCEANLWCSWPFEVDIYCATMIILIKWFTEIHNYVDCCWWNIYMDNNINESFVT